MTAAWRFVGEFWRGRDKVLTLTIMVVRPNFEEAEVVAKMKLVGADKITAVAVPPAEVSERHIRDGEVWL
jgi:hypothetical protein